MERLISVVQELSLAHDLPSIMTIVKRAARELTGADGATFVLRDGPYCYYADEDAVGPLWKGKRFPLETCISGWSMLHRQAAIIEDIYVDPRIPTDAYAPTFVKSLVMVPIRTVSPVGAIGNYWARKRLASPEEVRLLAALADSTSVAMENVQLSQTLERRVQERTVELLASREELAAKHDALVHMQRQKEELAAHLVHDLKSPASGIMLSCMCRLRSTGLSDADRKRWKRIYAGAEGINRMALDLLDITRSEDGVFTPNPCDMDLQGLLEEVVEMMSPLAEGCEQRLELRMELDWTALRADEELLRRVLQNLIDNALRHNPPGGTVQLLAREGAAGEVELRVLDQGPGIPAEMRQAIFDKYKRLAPGRDERTLCGRGLGLTFCKLAVQGHGGSIAVEANPPRGSAFIVRLPRGR
ncbi:ATP-binding protein [Hyalangium minutum]|uniref:histidine kinase n=1 Tax=Hyalangium minutum TaxID=394096 RepID=A0A085WEL6_9BACT|nr:ATP-binding protein [Hyalangium minutum]KFE66129.1 Osmosensitive K+ channel histidine kinase KdpD [Hyalangium minutum]